MTDNGAPAPDLDQLVELMWPKIQAKFDDIYRSKVAVAAIEEGKKIAGQWLGKEGAKLELRGFNAGVDAAIKICRALPADQSAEIVTQLKQLKRGLPS